MLKNENGKIKSFQFAFYFLKDKAKVPLLQLTFLILNFIFFVQEAKKIFWCVVLETLSIFNGDMKNSTSYEWAALTSHFRRENLKDSISRAAGPLIFYFTALEQEIGLEDGQ